MPHTQGLRGRTRHLFAKEFRRHGMGALTPTLISYRVGDYVDVVGNGGVQAGLPHKFYHGKTGRVFNVTKNGLGVVVNKRVGHRIIPKRINVRHEHVRKSASREAFKERIKQNDQLKQEANKKGQRISTKRTPGQPRAAHVVKSEVEVLNPLRFRYVF